MQYDNNCIALYYQQPWDGSITNYGIPVGQDWYAFVDNSHRHGNAIMLQGLMSLDWYNSIEDEVLPGAQMRVLPIAPNPVRDGAKLLIDLETADEVGVTIYNARGQMVRSIPKQSFARGQNTIPWDGCDNHGIKVSSGVYMLRVQGKSSVQTRKLVVLK
ncbi:MAG TPA: FlgD immunoglobulin-like domain containing protein [Candidatus Cloacimonadota bacterium]|nr:FlgD immunoglobulin-like domain containing protein [Candidatus Cloacimonadota bacterium]